jgi:hypothetical protein
MKGKHRRVYSSHSYSDDSHGTATETEDYDLANAEVEQILGTIKPKHVGEGLASGIGYILRGAIGACGALVVRTML